MRTTPRQPAQGRMGEAAEALGEAHRQRVEIYGAENPVTLRTAGAYGDALAGSGEVEEGEALIRETLELQRESTDELSGEAARTMGYLAALKARQGQYDEAEALFLPALEVVREDLPPAHPARQELIRALTDMYDDWGRPEEAERIREGETPDL